MCAPPDRTWIILIATPPALAAPIERRLTALLAGPWATHFTRELA